MLWKWNTRSARAGLDECNQDLFQAKARLEKLKSACTSTFDEIDKASSKVRDLEDELTKLLSEWEENTPREYRPKYTPDWPVIAKEVKDRAGWTCQECHAYLGGPWHKRLLHVHHVNRNSTDNRSSNLRALCLLCHSSQPDHYYLEYSLKDIDKIQAQRPAGDLNPQATKVFSDG